MPFSPFEDYLASECSSRNSDDVPGTEQRTFPDALNSAEDLNDTTIGSESVLSFQEAMSLDSSTLQDFGSIVSLPAGTLAGVLESLWREYEGSIEHSEDCTRSTIVSSAASGAQIPCPEASHDMWAVSPHPHLVSNDMLATSTVCTETLSYQKLIAGEAGSVVSSRHDNDTPDLLSLSNSKVSPPTSAHQQAAFQAIANRLLRDVGAGIPHGEMSGAWFCRFTDADWEQMREVAKVVLSTTVSPRKMLLPLPPSPPVHTYSVGRTNGCHGRPSEISRAQSMISSSFFCPCCNDIVVGALALDCGCTMCAACWEGIGAFPRGVAEDTDYVWVQQKECTNCGSVVHTTILCHALDVAIFQVVENLQVADNDTSIQSLKLAYYSRLEEWREAVVARNEFAIEQRAIEEDEMLARLIEQEEEMLWKKESQRQKTKSAVNGLWLVLCQAAVAVLAGTMSSVALHAIAKRR